MESIDVRTLNEWIIDNNALQLLDVRESWEFNHCSIGGSINIPISEIDKRLNELDHEKNIVVICHHGARSLQAAYYLQNSGFENRIINLEGGIDAWAEHIAPQMPRY